MKMTTDQLIFLLETISAGFMVIIAVVCGIIVTILVLSLMILCCMKNPACCYRMDSASKHKPTDVERYVCTFIYD